MDEEWVRLEKGGQTFLMRTNQKYEKRSVLYRKCKKTIPGSSGDPDEKECL